MLRRAHIEEGTHGGGHTLRRAHIEENAPSITESRQSARLAMQARQSRHKHLKKAPRPS